MNHPLLVTFNFSWLFSTTLTCCQPWLNAAAKTKKQTVMIQCCGWKLEASRDSADSITPIIKADSQHPSSAPLPLPSSSSSDSEHQLKEGSLQSDGARLWKAPENSAERRVLLLRHKPVICGKCLFTFHTSPRG